MVKNTKYLFTLAFLFLLGGCESGGGWFGWFGQKTHYVYIDVYTNKPVCSGQFPEELKMLATPFEIKDCKGYGFIPKVTIHRMDLVSKDSILIKPFLSRKLPGQEQPFFTEKQEINQMLESVGCDDILSKLSEKEMHMAAINRKESDIVIEFNSSKDSLAEKIHNRIYVNGEISGSRFIVLYKVRMDGDMGWPEDSVPPPPHDDCSMDFCKLIKSKLIAIGTCSTPKNYDKRFTLANDFISLYITDKTQIELQSPEGFVVDNYSGGKAKNYITELAEEERCVKEIKIPILTTSATDGGKISFIRIMEDDDKTLIKKID